MNLFITKYKKLINKSNKNFKQMKKICKNKKKCDNYILNKIKNNLSLSPLHNYINENNYNDIKILSYKNVKYTFFNSAIHNNIYYIYYLIKKYKNIITPINNDDIKNISDDFIQKYNFNYYKYMIDNNYNLLYYMTIKYSVSKNEIYIPINLNNKIINTIKNYKFNYIILSIHLLDYIYGSGHSNILLIDTIKKLIIIYEPHGYNYADNINDLYDKLQLYFNEFLKDYKFIKPKDYIDTIAGLQHFENFHKIITKYDTQGFCLAWSIWFIELYINNTQYELHELFNKTIKKMINMNILITNYIKNYADNLYNNMLKYLKKYNYDFYEKYEISFEYKEMKISNENKYKKLTEHYDLYNENEYINNVFNVLNKDLSNFIFKYIK